MWIYKYIYNIDLKGGEGGGVLQVKPPANEPRQFKLMDMNDSVGSFDAV